MDNSIISVENLKTYFYTRAGVVKAVDDVSFHVNPGESLGLAGESGCGKSVTCLSIVRLLPEPGGKIVGGKILMEGEDLVTKTQDEMREWRGKKIGIIFQDPMMSLNPVYTIGNQVSECYNLDHVKRNHIREHVIEVLRSVNIPAVEQRLGSYPFQFSGGMRQRTSAAIAIARSPKLLIADEPTTALDVTIQDQFLTLLKGIQQETGMGIIMVTHDLAVVAEICDRIAVMYGGKIVETGTVKRVYQEPAHPYTRALIKALPKLGYKTKRMYQIDGEPPNPADLPPGCSFHPRCPYVKDICRTECPSATEIANDGYAACWLLQKV